MKKYRLKKWVKPAVYALTLAVVAVTLLYTVDLMDKKNSQNPENTYVSEEIIDEDSTVQVAEPTNETINKPFTNENVTIAKDFYDDDKSEEEQLKAIIYYKNTYMENTGILYTNDEAFDVVSSLDGTVTSITKDDVLGNVVEITHSTELITIYHCLGEVAVAVGDSVKQNDVIGSSGKVSLDNGYENALLFEVNYKGSILNPNEFYNMKPSDLAS